MTSQDAHAGEGLTQHALDGVMWTAAQRWAIRISGFATVLVLTRLLSPESFGTVAVALTILPLTYALADLGFSTYIMQVERIGERTLDTAFWFTTVTGLILAGGLVGLAPVAAAMFHRADVASVIRGVAPAIGLVTLTTVPMALLRRQMRFRALAVQSVLGGIVGQVVAVVLALTGFGVWALVGQTIAGQVVVSALAWSAARWRPGFGMSLTEFRAMASFGTKVVGVELVATVRGLIENAVIAGALGVTGLGYLSIAQRLTQVMQDVTAAAILPVSTVLFARVRDAQDRLRHAYLRALTFSYAVIVPAMVFLVITAPSLLPLLFGRAWQPSVRPSQILAVISILVLGALLDHGLFYGAGRPGRWFVYAIAVDGLTVLAAVISARHGMEAWAYGFLTVASLATVLRWPLVGRLVGASSVAIGWVFLRAMLIGLAGAGAGWAIAAATPALPPVVGIALVGLGIGLAHALAMRLFLRDAWADAVQIVRTRLGARTARARSAEVAVEGAGPSPRVAVPIGGPGHGTD